MDAAGSTGETLAAGVRSGDPRALARAISAVEQGDPRADALVRAIYPETGRATVVGVTGPPGVGKSTLVAALVSHLRPQLRIGFLSIDPSSAFTGGAVLGDRIRLTEHFLDEGVFIRSMATRGHLGGLSEATLQSVLLLDAAGYELVVVETVGIGQSEIEVVGISDVVVLVLMPGAGDAVQALKAGVMEIPDVIAVNKSDRPGADAALQEIRSVVGLDPVVDRRPAVVRTSGATGAGVEELWRAVSERRDALEASGELIERRRRNLVAGVVDIGVARLKARLEGAIEEDAAMRQLLDQVADRALDPLTAAARLVEHVALIRPDDASDAG